MAKDAPPPVIIKGVDAEMAELDNILEDVREIEEATCVEESDHKNSDNADEEETISR